MLKMSNCFPMPHASVKCKQGNISNENINKRNIKIEININKINFNIKRNF